MIAPASRKIGKFEIRQKLGRGGMADVYLAQDTETNQTVALKLIEHSADPDTCASIEAEMRGATLQARLADIDPHVVRVFGAGDLEGFFHVSMEYVEGQDLATLMRRGKLEIEFAVDVALAVAETLDKAHKLETSIAGKEIRGIVHGDIKPKNIRIDARGEVRVLDFGIAKALSLSRKLTRNEFGSVPYASPERLESGEVNVGSDLWSLSVMLYEMVTGLQPYQAETTARLERMIRSGIAPPPAPDPCPEGLRRILMKALAPDPELRYESAADLGLDLAAFRAGGKVQATQEDLDATRRTYRRAEVAEETQRTASEETRRTGHAAPEAAVAPHTDAAVKKTAKSNTGLYQWVMRGVGATVLACGVYVALAGASEFRLYEHGKTLEHDIESEELTDPSQIWTRWSELSKDNPSSFFLRGPRKAAKDKFVAAAAHVIGTYRNNDAPVSEQDWNRAHTLLLHALSTDPEDAGVRGDLRLTEGHLLRISGGKHQSAQELDDAVEKFTESQQLIPHSPDPALGMARSYIALRDVDKAAAAFHQAELNGYTLGDRERSQLADGYWDRANRTWQAAYSLRGLPQEKEQIQQAAEDYKRALDLYQKSGGYGNSNERIKDTQTSLESIQTRIEQIDQGQGANDPPDAITAHRNRVAGAIRDFFNALRDKSTKPNPGGTSH